MRGIRWSASSKATLSLRTFNCLKRLRAPSGESLPITRYSAPYWERRSRSIARKTSESSSTLSKIGLGMIVFQSGIGGIPNHNMAKDVFQLTCFYCSDDNNLRRDSRFAPVRQNPSCQSWLPDHRDEMESQSGRATWHCSV